MSLLVSGRYQDLQILDGEFSVRAGFNPGRGWVHVLLSDLGGSLPQSARLKQLKPFYLRSTAKDNKKAEVIKSFDPSFVRGPGGVDTGYSETSTAPEPPGPFSKLKGPFGDLVLKTHGEAGKETERILHNIFWTEAVIEDLDHEGAQGVVRIELADQRILWDTGGYICGNYNETLNQLTDNVWGDVLQWDPVENKLTTTKALKDALVAGDEYRPILNPDTLIKMKKSGKTVHVPWTLSSMILHIFQTLPGPPKIGIVSQDIFKQGIPFNLKFDRGSQSKKELEDLFRRYDLELCPSLDLSGFFVYDRRQSAMLLQVVSEKTIDPSFRIGPWIDDRAVTLDLQPLSVEVVGERIMEEIQCPCWSMVIKDVGIVEKENGLLGRQGQWVRFEDYCSAYGLDRNRIARAILANWDKEESSAFDKVIPGTFDEPQRKAIATALRANCFKSYMVDGPFRKFLPMVLKRAEGASQALNMDNLCFTRGATFLADSWGPGPSRKIGIDALFGNAYLARIEESDIAQIDDKEGVITFSSPQGIVVYNPNFDFLNEGGDDFKGLEQALSTFKSDAADIALKIQEYMDRKIYDSGTPDSRIFLDVTYELRGLMVNFLRRYFRTLDVEVQKLIFNEKTLEAVSERLSPIRTESFIGEYQRPMTRHNINLSQCTLFEPRIIGIWAWERNFGRSDDWFRYRGGLTLDEKDEGSECPEAPPFLLYVKGLRQFVAMNGATNRHILEFLAKQQIEKYLAKGEKPIAGGEYKFWGFHKLPVCGTRQEVVYRMSNQDPPIAETTSSVCRYMHGIAGRPPAVTTWSGHQKPAVLGEGR